MSIREVLPALYAKKAGNAVPYIQGTPLVYCIEKFGGVQEFCQAIGRTYRQVYRWRNAGGILSTEAQTEAVIAAKRLGIELDLAKLVYVPPMSPVVAKEQREEGGQPRKSGQKGGKNADDGT